MTEMYCNMHAKTSGQRRNEKDSICQSGCYLSKFKKIISHKVIFIPSISLT